MKTPIGFTASAIVLCFFLFSALPGLATENKHTEDFSTTQYKDSLNTTAN